MGNGLAGSIFVFCSLYIRAAAYVHPSQLQNSVNLCDSTESCGILGVHKTQRDSTLKLLRRRFAKRNHEMHIRLVRPHFNFSNKFVVYVITQLRVIPKFPLKGNLRKIIKTWGICKLRSRKFTNMFYGCFEHNTIAPKSNETKNISPNTSFAAISGKCEKRLFRKTPQTNFSYNTVIAPGMILAIPSIAW